MGTNTYWGSPALLSTDASGNTVLVGADGNNFAAQSTLVPTGNDDALLLQEFIADGGGFIAPGDLILGTSVTLKTAFTTGVNAGGVSVQSAYLNMTGAGIGRTRIRMTPGVTLRISPDRADASYGAGALFPHINEMEFIACDANGDQLPDGTNAGSCLEFRTDINGEAAVSSNVRMQHVTFDNFSNAISFDDTTFAELNGLIFKRFDVAVRLGYNCDLIKFVQSMWGGGIFPYQGSAVGVQTNWTYTGQPNAPSSGGASAMVFDTCAAANIFRFMDMSLPITPLTFRSCYWESMRQIIFATSGSAAQFPVKLQDCYITRNNVNGDAAYPLFDFTDSDVQPKINIENCHTDSAPIGAFIAHNNAASVVNWRRSNVFPHAATYGHIFSTIANYGGKREIPYKGAVDCVIGSTQADFATGGGLSRFDKGEPFVTTYSPAAGGTVTLDHRVCDHAIINVPDNATPSGITITTGDYLYGAAIGTEFTIELRTPATVTSTQTVTWNSTRFKPLTATVTALTTDNSKRRIYNFRNINLSATWVQTTPDAPAWV